MSDAGSNPNPGWVGQAIQGRLVEVGWVRCARKGRKNGRNILLHTHRQKKTLDGNV